LGVDFGVTAEVRKSLHQIVMDLRSWRRIADNEALGGEFVPMKLIPVCQRMFTRQDNKHTLRPKLFRFAIRPFRRAGYEGDIEPKLAHGRHMLGRIAVN